MRRTGHKKWNLGCHVTTTSGELFGDGMNLRNSDRPKVRNRKRVPRGSAAGVCNINGVSKRSQSVRVAFAVRFASFRRTVPAGLEDLTGLTQHGRSSRRAASARGRCARARGASGTQCRARARPLCTCADDAVRREIPGESRLLLTTSLGPAGVHARRHPARAPA